MAQTAILQSSSQGSPRRSFSDGIDRIKGNVTKAVDLLIELLESDELLS
jgi:hypothetical protein